MIYLLHFHRRYKHAGHYLGFAENLSTLKARLKRHRSGNGARLVEVINAAGINWELVRVWRGEGADRNQERRMKKMGGLSRKCPICSDGSMMRNNIVIEERNEQHTNRFED